MLQGVALLAGLATLVAGQTAITINVGTRYQQIDGFGFSQAFGRAAEFERMSNKNLQRRALDLLFSRDVGAGFSVIRNRIGSGGSGDSILPNNPGSPSATPNYVWDGYDSGQVWFTREAVGYGVNKIYADAWSAPGFMKTSGNEATAGYLCGTPGHSCSSGDWRQAYANFLVRYVQFYAQEGLTVTHLGFLNEPDFSPGYSQMQISSDASEAINFIPILDTTVNSAGLNLALTCCDAVGWNTQSTYTTALVRGGSTSRLDVITGHSYGADATTPLSQTTLPKWNTEGGPLSSAFTTTWYSNGAANEGFTWANKLAVAMVNAQLSAYLFWEGFEIGQTQSAAHLVDTYDGSTATASGIFWAFAMWSRHIRPGAHRVATSGSMSNVIIGAFQNTDGSVVAVFTNSGGSSASAAISFSGFTPRAASAWQTSQGSTFASTSSSLSGGRVTVSVPAHGVVTVRMT